MIHIPDITHGYEFVDKSNELFIREELESLGAVYPLEYLESGNFAQAFRDANDNILRVSSVPEDYFTDKIIVDKNYIPLMAHELFIFGDGSKTENACGSVTLRQDLPEISEDEMYFDTESLQNTLQFFDDVLTQKAIERIVTFFEKEDCFTNVDVGNVFDAVLGHEMCPEIASAFTHELRQCLKSKFTIKDVVNIHRKHFGFLYDHINESGDLCYEGPECSSAIHDIRHHFIGIMQFIDVLNNDDLREMLLQIVDAYIDFEEVTGFFPYDVCHSNLGLWNGNIVIRDYYYLPYAYPELQKEIIAKIDGIVVPKTTGYGR